MKPQDENTETKKQSVSARMLVEQVYLSGDLSSISFSSVSGLEGTRLHQKVFGDIKKSREGAEVETEVSLTTSFIREEFTLSISGRADCLITEKNDTSVPGRMSLIEVKAHNRQNAVFDDLYRPVHRAQLIVYAHMLMESHPEVEGLEIILRYVSIQTLIPLEKPEWITRAQAAEFFEETCRLYQAVALRVLDDRQRRNATIRLMTFPYGGLRDGQRALMEHVVGSIRCKQILFAEAPTGIGKTIGVLFPSLKCLARGFSDKIFYLTAKISTRDIARKTLNDLRENGLFARSILLSSKELMCPHKDLYCEPRVCPCAIGYYDRLKGGLNELFDVQDISPSVILETASKHCLCPFELSLDISIFCDVIIADYNHAFHPRIRLERFFNDPTQSHILLNDEAHNMVDRSRDMFSAQLNYETFRSFTAVSRGLMPEIDGLSDSIDRYFLTAYESVMKGDKVFDRIERDYSDERVYIADDFRSVKLIPKTLYGGLWRICYRLSFVLDSIPVGPIRKAILEFFFEARFFLTIIEQYFDDSYIYTLRVERHAESSPQKPPSMVFSLSCLDASGFISSQIRDRHPCVFFSATLSPPVYYRTMLVGSDLSGVDEIAIDSPFPPENLSVRFHTEIRTVYKERFSTIDAVVECINGYVSKACGNFLAYFPSFQYMNMVYGRYCEKHSKDDGTEIIIQGREMSASDKDRFLERFDRYGDRTLLGFAVLGGHFGEGIDLVGERLSGVFVVGVGIPQISPEREILRQYFQEKFGDGYSFAYRFPGWEKVLQASGRVIRDETDQGFVVLIDHRYATPEYRTLYPKHWQTDLPRITNDGPPDDSSY